MPRRAGEDYAADDGRVLGTRDGVEEDEAAHRVRYDCRAQPETVRPFASRGRLGFELLEVGEECGGGTLQGEAPVVAEGLKVDGWVEERVGRWVVALVRRDLL